MMEAELIEAINNLSGAIFMGFILHGILLYKSGE